jgi:L-iditol 2-dehydrogenase
MKAVRFPVPGRAELVEVPVPRPQPGEVLIRVRAAGICASDVGAFLGKHDVRKPPVITGHELAGEIVEVGSESATRRVGERVAVEPHVGCGTCVFCREGHYHECPRKRFIGVGEWIGAFAEHVVATEGMCHPIPERMSFDEGAALEPFCVGLHAVRRSGLHMGESVAVFGVGTIGMMTLLAARCTAPGWVGVSDLSAFKRQTALRCGAHLAVDPGIQDPVETIQQATDGLGVDVVFVAVPSNGVVRQAVRVCRRMGRLVIIASFFEGGVLELRQIQVRERTVIGTSMYTGADYRLAIRLWERGALGDLGSLITERIILEDAPAVIAELAQGHRPDTIKTIIHFD